MIFPDERTPDLDILGDTAAPDNVTPTAGTDNCLPGCSHMSSPDRDTEHGDADIWYANSSGVYISPADAPDNVIIPDAGAIARSVSTPITEPINDMLPTVDETLRPYFMGISSPVMTIAPAPA